MLLFRVKKKKTTNYSVNGDKITSFPQGKNEFRYRSIPHTNTIQEGNVKALRTKSITSHIWAGKDFSNTNKIPHKS